MKAAERNYPLQEWFDILGNYSHSPPCQKLDEKIDTILRSVW